MSSDFEKRSIADLGQKLSHIEGILGAYLPKHVFDGDVQQRTIDCTKYSFSRMRSGQRKAANWELARFIELFDLARFGFDYRLFFGSFEEFDAALRKAGVGSYGSSVAERLRETLREQVASDAEIKIGRDRRLNVGGIGGLENETGLLSLTQRDTVTLTVPLAPMANEKSYFLLLHDFPAERAMSCLMPSVFAPEREVSGTSLRLPLVASGHISFPVGGTSGYRCLYSIQTTTDLVSYIGLEDAEHGTPDIHSRQITMLVDFLANAASAGKERIHVGFGEYLLK